MPNDDDDVWIGLSTLVITLKAWYVHEPMCLNKAKNVFPDPEWQSGPKGVMSHKMVTFQCCWFRLHWCRGIIYFSVFRVFISVNTSSYCLYRIRPRQMMRTHSLLWAMCGCRHCISPPETKNVRNATRTVHSLCISRFFVMTLATSGLLMALVCFPALYHAE